ncbi:hypothetical protein CECT5772_03159 [Streptococcus equi subsp. ruminatorum CECT 5772]|uniref:Uncharacterized protein n=1 Tax=Streptococcus equi subsp. ruminatorum CECT 5772 TaxID=1051981 RepID=A0A922NVP6_9STRE|nr:hypothetical protein CECT5772_03159 [Streptococcus equi subsp. ruminatorum CECT 5772]
MAMGSTTCGWLCVLRGFLSCYMSMIGDVTAEACSHSESTDVFPSFLF